VQPLRRAHRIAHKNRRSDPAVLCKNGRARLLVESPASQRLFSALRRRLPHPRCPSWRVGPSREWVQSSAPRSRLALGAEAISENLPPLREEAPQAAPMELRGEEQAPAPCHTAGRSASPPEQQHGIWDRFAYSRNELRLTVESNRTTYLITPCATSQALFFSKTPTSYSSIRGTTNCA
jgi:hypothetical protein